MAEAHPIVSAAEIGDIQEIKKIFEDGDPAELVQHTAPRVKGCLLASFWSYKSLYVVGRNLRWNYVCSLSDSVPEI